MEQCELKGHGPEAKRVDSQLHHFVHPAFWLVQYHLDAHLDYIALLHIDEVRHNVHLLHYQVMLDFLKIKRR